MFDRWTILLLPAVLLACAPPGPPPQWKAEVGNPKRVQVGTCEFSAEFAAPPSTFRQDDNGTVSQQATYDGTNSNQHLLCICGDNLNAAQVTRSDTDTLVNTLVRGKKGDMVTDSQEFFDGPLGQELRYNGRFPKSMFGAIRVKARFLFSGKCMTMVSTNFLESDTAKSEAFLASVANVNKDGQTAAPIEEQLKALKLLYDKGVITPSEYEAKRQEILRRL
jgi:hypothetical protein